MLGLGGRLRHWTISCFQGMLLSIACHGQGNNNTNNSQTNLTYCFAFVVHHFLFNYFVVGLFYGKKTNIQYLLPKKPKMYKMLN